MKVIIINGPNLNMLGFRDAKAYGSQTLDEINEAISKRAAKIGVEVSFFQSNCEGELVSAIQNARGVYDAMILNAGAYTHYSYAIADAIPIANMPVVEVHLSNIHAREAFRDVSVIAPLCVGQICGFGANSYIIALDAVVRYNDK